MNRNKGRLSLETLEDRLVLTAWGTPWPGQLTVSFVPDGTTVGSQQSATPQGVSVQAWKGEILRTLQTWAASANVNVGLVNDGGQPLGTPGRPVGDARFGDIRIAAVPLGMQSSVAISSPTTRSRAPRPATSSSTARSRSPWAGRWQLRRVFRRPARGQPRAGFRGRQHGPDVGSLRPVQRPEDWPVGERRGQAPGALRRPPRRRLRGGRRQRHDRPGASLGLPRRRRPGEFPGRRRHVPLPRPVLRHRPGDGEGADVGAEPADAVAAGVRLQFQPGRLGLRRPIRSAATCRSRWRTRRPVPRSTSRCRGRTATCSGSAPIG